MRPLLRIALTWVLLGAILCTSQSFSVKGENVKTFSVSDCTAKEGSRVYTDLTGTAIDDLSAFVAEISYDSSMLRFCFLRPLREDVISMASTPFEGQLRIVCVCKNSLDISCETAILRISFETLREGESELIIENAQISDSLGNKTEIGPCENTKVTVSKKDETTVSKKDRVSRHPRPRKSKADSSYDENELPEVIDGTEASFDEGTSVKIEGSSNGEVLPVIALVLILAISFMAMIICKFKKKKREVIPLE